MVPQLQISDQETGPLVKPLGCQVSSLSDYGNLPGLLSSKPVQAGQNESLPQALTSKFTADSDEPDLACASSRIEVTGNVTQDLIRARSGYKNLLRASLAVELNPCGVKSFGFRSGKVWIGKKARVVVSRSRNGLQS